MLSGSRRPSPVLAIVVAVVAVAFGGYLAVRLSHAAGLVGDLNNDGTVNVFDLSILLSDWGTNNATADINKDGTVNIFDLSILLSNWGLTASPSPTPSTSPTASPAPTSTPTAGCTSPLYSASWPQTQFAGWQGSGGSVQNDVQSDGTGPATDTQQLNICSLTNWNVVANWGDRGGSINAYPDTDYDFTSDKTISQYNSLQTCYGEKEPTPSGPQWPTAGGSEWDYAYDVWINHHTGENIWSNDIEIMVWNDYTDTSIYPPSGSRAVTIDGVGYHLFQGGGANEWIYTRDTKATSDCIDMLKFMQDLVAHNSAAAGITSASAPQHLEYGVEISGTHGTQTFQITNATLTAN
jgi:hypothetical protein